MVKAAVVFAWGEPVKIESLSLRTPGPNEVLVRLVASGVCHSDLSVVRGVLPLPPPVVLGHEGAGIVEEVGRDVHDLKPGDHVVLSWVENCGRCYFCTAGRPHLCDANVQAVLAGEEGVFKKDGTAIPGMMGVGSFAERTVVRASAAVKIRDDVPLDRACLVGCGVMTGVGAAVNTARVRPGETVAVFGCGGVGLNVIQGAALCGAARVIAVDLIPEKLETARVFGATDTINGRAVGNVPEAIRSLTGGLGVDYAFEVIGSSAVIAQAFQSLKRGGKVVVVGVPPLGDDTPVSGFTVALDEKGIIGSLYGSGNVRREMPMLIDLYAQKRLKLDELVSRRIRLEQVNEAFQAMEAGEVARSVIVYE